MTAREPLTEPRPELTPRPTQCASAGAAASSPSAPPAKPNSACALISELSRFGECASQIDQSDRSHRHPACVLFQIREPTGEKPYSYGSAAPTNRKTA